jgi:C-terminal processing protease CtpA/Prc
MYKRIKNPAIRTRLIENKVIITKLLNDSLKSMGVEVGDEIVQIDGVDAIEYGRKNVEPFVSASTKQDEINRTYDYELLYGDKNTPVKLKLKKKDGKTTDVSLSRKMKKLNFGQDYGFKVTPENIGILTINSFYVDNYDHLFDSLYPAILKTKALVIDVRENGGGSTEQGAYVISHLIDKPSLGSKWRTRQITAAMVSWQWQPAWYDAEAFTVDPVVGKRYLNPVVVLTSARTFSAAEDFVVMYDNTKRGIKIGQPTGGSTGNPLSFKLPGGGNARICTKHDYYPDGKEFVGVGIKPDIEVDETIDGIRSGTDPVMNKAIDYLSQKIK